MTECLNTAKYEKLSIDALGKIMVDKLEMSDATTYQEAVEEVSMRFACGEIFIGHYDYYRTLLSVAKRRIAKKSSGTPKLETVAELIDAFYTETLPSGKPVYRLYFPDSAKGECFSASNQFVAFAKQHGFTAQLLHLEGYKPHSLNGIIGPDNGAYPKDFDWSAYGHYAVAINDQWADWTACQMDSLATFPYVRPLSEEAPYWTRIMEAVLDEELTQQVRSMIGLK